MGWSIRVQWPGITPEQQDAAPGFFNDDHAWAELVCAVLGDRTLETCIAALDLAALLAGSDGEWTTPDELKLAALNLRILVAAGDPQVRPLVEAYAPGAADPAEAADWLVQDLGDLEAIADYAIAEGAHRLALGYER